MATVVAPMAALLGTCVPTVRAYAAPVAEPVESSRPEPRQERWQVVLMTRNRRPSVDATIRAHLVDLPVDFTTVELSADEDDDIARARGVAGKHDADLVLWFHEGKGGELYVFLSQPQGGRTLVRDLATGDGQGGDAEEIATIVRSTLEALMRGGRIGVEVPTPTPNESAPAPKGKPARGTKRPRIGFGLASAYSVEGFAPEHVAVHGVAIGAELDIGPFSTIWLRYRSYLPVEITKELVDVTIHRFPIELGGRGHYTFGRVGVGGGAVFVMSPTRGRLSRVELPVTAGEEAFDLGLALGVLAHGSVRLVGQLRLISDIGVDVDLQQITYFLDGSPPVNLLTPWRFRPRAQVGLSLRI